jgi:hypothetical protein
MRARSLRSPLRLAFVLTLLAVPLVAAASPPRTAPASEAAAPAAVLYDQTFRVRAGGELQLDLGSENVTIRTVRGDRARVVVEGTGRDAESEFQRRRFSARAERGDLVVRTDPPRRSPPRRRLDARFQVTVEVPRRYSAVLDLGSGNADVASLDGDVRVDAGSGTLRLADVDGNVTLDAGSGNVRLGAVHGDLRIDAGSGDLDVERVDGVLAADTGSGRVRVGSVGGPVHVESGSGGVELGIRSRSEVDVRAGSGSVVLRLARSAGFDVDLSGGSVQIDRALDFRGRTERRSARGELGRGGAELRVRSGSGAIRLLADGDGRRQRRATDWR